MTSRLKSLSLENSRVSMVFWIGHPLAYEGNVNYGIDPYSIVHSYVSLNTPVGVIAGNELLS